MIIYWPNNQSLNLNLAVASLFTQTYRKCSSHLINNTTAYLPIDILEKSIQKRLFMETLIELEIIILDIIELNLSQENIKELYNQISYDIIKRTIYKFIDKVNHHKYISLFFTFEYNLLFFHEHSILIQYLLLYLIFGASSIDNRIFAFYNLKTPFYHVKSLFENTIIQISNIITLNLLECYESIEKMSSVFLKKNLHLYKYQSIRDLSNFYNNLISNNWLNFYINYPYNIYCSKYKVLLFNSKGIMGKYITMNRSNNYKQLSTLQLCSIIYLETQDFILPKLNSLITLIGKLIIYILNEIVAKSIQICFKNIVEKLSRKKH